MTGVAPGVARETPDERARLQGTEEQQYWLRQVLRDWQYCVKSDSVCQQGRVALDVPARLGVLLAHLGAAAGLGADQYYDLVSSGFLPAKAVQP